MLCNGRNGSFVLQCSHAFDFQQTARAEEKVREKARDRRRERLRLRARERERDSKREKRERERRRGKSTNEKMSDQIRLLPIN